MKLFRNEVIEKQQNRILGEVVLHSPLRSWSVILLLLVIFCGIIVFLLFGEYARKELVAGVLTPNKGLVQISAHQVGAVENVYVETGDPVFENTPLFAVQSIAHIESGDTLSGALLSKMSDEKENLISQLSALPNRYGLQIKGLESQKQDLLSEASRIADQISIQKDALELEIKRLDRISTLFKSGSAPASTVTTNEMNVLSERQRLEQLNNSREKVFAQVRRVESEINLLPLRRKDEELELNNRISSLDQEMLRADAIQMMTVVSPVEGKVAAVTIRKGQIANPGKMSVAILPEGGELVAELFVPTRAAGFVTEGQPVRLRYDAFPYQKFGFHDGVVQQISKTVILTSDLPIAPQQPEPVYLVTVKLDNQNVDVSDETFPLQSGMVLTADIILENRKIWEWAFEPLLRALK